MPIVAVRAAGVVYGAVDIDECDWLITGRIIAGGGVPYVDFVEKKPILSFLFYAPVALTGGRPWLVQLLAMAWVFATCLVVARTAREWTGREEAGWAAGWLACLAHVACRPAVNAETMLNLPAALALFFFLRAERSRALYYDLLTGVAIGVASLFKHQGGIVLASLLASLAWKRDAGPPRVARAAVIGVGFAAPWILVGGVYAASGHFAAFYLWNVTKNLAYQAARGSGSALDPLAEGLLVGLLLATPILWALATAETSRAFRDGDRDPVRRGILLTLWLTWVPVSLGGRFYDHYFIQFVPALALAATPEALRRIDAWPTLARWRRGAVSVAVAAPVAIFLGIAWGGGLLGRHPLQEPRTLVLARWIRENSAPDEKIYVWGHWAPIYVLAERLPGARSWNASAVVGDFDPHHLPEGFDIRPHVSPDGVADALHDLTASRTALFVDTAPADIHDWHRVPLDAVPELFRYVHEHYALAGEPAGAPVYRRR